MPVSLSDLVAKLKLDTSQFQRGVDQAKRSTTDLATSTDKATKKTESGFRKVAIGIGGAFAAAKVGQFFKSAISAASDLGESMSKVGVVFGDSAVEVQSFAKTAAKSIGQSQQQALEAAGTFGNLAVALGLPQAAAADMSVSLVKLASDLASFNNVTTDEALLALRSGLVGEAEPLRKFGVSISAARVETEAFNLGLVAGKEALAAQGGALTAAQKAQAIYSIIMKDTAVAQGDFARTSGGLANQQRILAAQFQNLQASIGQALLPVLTKVTPLLSGILNTVTKIPGPITAAAIGFVGLAGGVAASIRVIDFLKPGVLKLGKAFEYLRNTLAGIKFVGIFNTAKAAAASLGSSIAKLIPLAFNPLTLAVTAATAALFVWNKEKQAAKKRAEEFTEALKQEASGIQDATEKLIINKLESEGLLKVLNDAGISIDTVVRAIEGERDAAIELQAALRDNGLMTVEVAGRIVQLADAHDKGKAAADRQASAEKDVGVAAEGAAGGIDEAADATKDAKTETNKYAAATDKLKDAFKEADDAIGFFQESLDRYLGVILDAEEAHDNVIEAVNDLKGAFKDAGGSFEDVATTNSEAGLKVRDALRDVVRANQDYVEAMITSGRVSRDQGFNVLRERLRDLQKRFPFLKDEIQKYINKVREADRLGISNPVTQPGMQAALQNLKTLRQRIGDIGSVGIRVYTDQAAGTRAGGGPVMAGRAYWVGEEGRELFIPSVQGTVIDHDASVAGTSGGAWGSTSIQVSAGPFYITATDGRDAALQMQRVLRDWEREAGQRLEQRIRVGARG